MTVKASKIYVGCALTDAPEQFKTSVEDFKNALKKMGYEVFDFVGLTAGTALDVYRWDIDHCVKDCDVFIGICDFPSIGLGFETNQALRLGKSILLVAHEGSKVTRLVLGAAEAEPTIRFERYSELKTDIMPHVLQLVDSVS